MSAVLAVSEFRALWFAEAQSVAGDQLAKVALMIMVYSRTGSAWWAAAVYALTFLPALAGGLGLSQLADRFPRKPLMVTCSLIQAALVGLMAIPNVPIEILCVLVVGVQLVQSPALAAQQAVTREVFTDDALYLRSQDLRGITTNTLMLVGLAGGGLLVVGIGTSLALAADALTFLIAALVVQRWVHNRPVAGKKEDGWFHATRWVFSQRKMRVLLALTWLVGLVVVPEGLAAPLAHEMGASPAAVGWLLAADPLGFVIGAFVLSHYVGPQHRIRIVGVLATLSVGMLVGFLLHPNLAFALTLLALAGATGAYSITVGAAFNTWAPNGLRGGAFGIARTGMRVAQGLGVALGGAVAELTGSAMNTVGLAGVVGLLIAVPATIAWRSVQRGLRSELGYPTTVTQRSAETTN
ncbi:MAG TPA: MFS transporter [Actinophytocola sp.]|uniref:MFS transporter n=1 Tax=Actinophytocola sp. TaxID=1872138 RepID=UPI002DBFD5F7|nr:MFS transporter [Actinophytocola sp.]HEU5471448.1 MFS transporter [Actinophytocola sp.]